MVLLVTLQGSAGYMVSPGRIMQIDATGQRAQNHRKVGTAGAVALDGKVRVSCFTLLADQPDRNLESHLPGLL